MAMKSILRLLGVETNDVGHAEKLISTLGALIAIALTMTVSLHVVGGESAMLLVASMGASAVLLFAVPHGALSQPWPLIGGNVISAVIGVSCALFIDNHFVAGPVAVSLAIFAMHYLRCLHPPGGATALVAVVGGPAVHALGYQFVLTPVMLNVAIMLAVAVAVNYPFPWRRYPASLRKVAPTATTSTSADEQLSHKDFAYALREIGSYVDVTEADLAKIYRLALKHARRASTDGDSLAVGNYYSNGEYGGLLSVRKIIKLSGKNEAATVSYSTVAGVGDGSSGQMPWSDFLAWRRYEVIPVEGEWHRIMEL